LLQVSCLGYLRALRGLWRHARRPTHGAPATGGAQNVTWVPDEQVNECPICNRTFGISLRKHHCRACGRVVCGYCSNNTLSVTGHGRGERACDPCFDLRRHDTTATLADNQSNMVQVEQSLKADLKLKHQQAEWFRSFLVRISAEASAPRSPGASFAAALDAGAEGASSPRSLTASFSGEEEGGELQGLIANARRRWKDVCEELWRREAESDRLRRECEQVERQCQRHQANSQELRRAVKSMESDLKRRPQVEVERDQLLLRTRTLEEELEGLNQRKASLEASRPSPGASFFSACSGSSGSLGGSFRQFQERVNGCTNRCRQQ